MTCGYPGCVGVPPAGREYCAVHRPEAVAGRAKALVSRAIMDAARKQPFIARQKMLMQLETDLHTILDETL